MKQAAGFCGLASCWLCVVAHGTLRACSVIPVEPANSPWDQKAFPMGVPHKRINSACHLNMFPKMHLRSKY